MRFKITKKWRLYTVLLAALGIVALSGFLSYRLSATTPSQIDETASDTVIATETIAEPTETESVCLDPGHGGRDVGAVYGKIYESNINLSVALQAKSILENDGYRVYLTRSDDTNVAKRARAAYCNSVSADILVSVHHNSYETDRSVDYATTLYYKEGDQLLASSVLNSTAARLSVKNQGISKFDNSLLWVANMPAVLSEAFFISNRAEYSLLQKTNSTRLTDEAAGIATGIENYFTHPELVQTAANNDSLDINRND